MPDFSKLLARFSEFDPTKYVDEALGVLVILILAWVLIVLSRRAIRLFAQFAVRNADDPEDRRRVATLSRVFRYLSTVTIIALTVMLVLGQIGISIAPILGAAGVVGIAVGFGAQSVVKDFFNGFTILLENKIRQGDVVTVGGKSGVVENVTLRTVRLRDYEGNVHFIPTGTIEIVTNMSMEFSNAVMDIGVGYRENVDEVFTVMRETAAAMREDPDYGPKILADLDIAGVDQWADSSVMIRCRLKCRPLEQWAVRREYLRRLKHAFDARGIEIPFPHVTVYAGQPKTGEAPALPLRVETGATRPVTPGAFGGG
jgi:small-conductance mechanosensitive channel